jgi:tetratricopeptide (TPR) repeat protein
MTAENDRFLQRIAEGDTLSALSLLASGAARAGSARLTLNAFMYGPSDEEHQEPVREAEQAHLERVGQPDPIGQAAVLYNLGCFALVQDDILTARLRFVEALQQEPDNLFARHNLAYALELLAETEQARAEYERVLAGNPGLALTRLNLALLDLQEGDDGRGLETLEALHGEHPDNMGLLLYLCRGLLLRGSPSDLERVLALTGEAPGLASYLDLQECRAYALFLRGEMDAAEAGFAGLLEQNGENRFALGGMLKVLAHRSDFKAMQPYAERYAGLSPNENLKELLVELETLP